MRNLSLSMQVVHRQKILTSFALVNILFTKRTNIFFGISFENIFTNDCNCDNCNNFDNLLILTLPPPQKKNVKTTNEFWWVHDVHYVQVFVICSVYLSILFFCSVTLNLSVIVLYCKKKQVFIFISATNNIFLDFYFWGICSLSHKNLQLL